MGFRFWLLLFASVFIPLAVLGFFGWRSMEDFQKRSEESAWKREIKASRSLYSDILNEKASFLRKEAARVLLEKKIRPESPFYGLILREEPLPLPPAAAGPEAAGKAGGEGWPAALGPPPFEGPSEGAGTEGAGSLAETAQGQPLQGGETLLEERAAGDSGASSQKGKARAAAADSSGGLGAAESVQGGKTAAAAPPAETVYLNFKEALSFFGLFSADGEAENQREGGKNLAEEKALEGKSAGGQAMRAEKAGKKKPHGQARGEEEASGQKTSKEEAAHENLLRGILIDLSKEAAQPPPASSKEPQFHFFSFPKAFAEAAGPEKAALEGPSGPAKIHLRGKAGRWPALSPASLQKAGGAEKAPFAMAAALPIFVEEAGGGGAGQKELEPPLKKTSEEQRDLMKTAAEAPPAAAKQIMAGEEPPRQPAEGKRGRKTAIAFIKDKSFFHLALPEKASKVLGRGADVFLIDSGGRLVFHSSRRRAGRVLPLKSSLLKSIKDPAKRGRSSWFLKVKKASGERELFYIKKWKNSGSYLAARQIRPPFAFRGVFQEKGGLLKWAGLHLIAGFLIFLCAAFLALPMAAAYRHIKFAFIHIGKTGRLPPFDQRKNKNPFLSFYGNWGMLVGQWLADKKRDEDGELSEIPAAEDFGSFSFQRLARAQAEKLKLRYPGLTVEEDFQDDIKLWGFGHSMKLILQELFSNAVEAMGGSPSQRILVSARIDSDQFVFSVRDYGAGASFEDYEKMLQLYYSTKSQLGVGLNVADSLVRSHDGRLDFFSPSDGGGLKVQISLPMKCFLKRPALAGFGGGQPPEKDNLQRRDGPPPAPQA